MNTKNTLLVLGFLLSLFICYKLAFSKTIALKNQAKSLEQEEVLANSIPKQLSTLKQKTNYYNSILNKHKLSESSIQNNLLNTLNAFATKNNIKVIQFTEPHIIKTNNILAKTYKFTLEGRFNKLLKLLYNLEQKTSFGEIINTHFEKKKNFRTGKNYLQMHVLIKSVE